MSFSRAPAVTGKQRPLSAQVMHLGARKRAAAFAMSIAAAALRCMAKLRDGNVKGVLILEPFGMGDMISHQPLIQGLLGRYDVRVCARPEWRSLYPEIERWVGARVPWSSYEQGAKYSAGRYLSREFREFRRALGEAGRGCIGLDTRGDIRSINLLYLAGCRRVLTLSSYLGADLENPAWVAERVPFHPERRRWEMNVGFLEALGVQTKGGPPRFAHLKQTRTPMSDRELGLVPIAPWKGKWWAREKWMEVVRTMTSKGWRVTGLCGPGQREVAGAELGQGVAIVECGSIEQWADELQKRSALVTVDTGGMHLADALGVPLVALFGQGLLPLWAPSGPRSRVLSRQGDPDFVLCHQVEENAPQGRKFMDRIASGEVIQALETLERAGRTEGD